MVLTTVAKKMVGESSGTVMRQNGSTSRPVDPRRLQQLVGHRRSPADMMMKDRPRNCQMVMTATAGRAQVALSSAGGVGLMPSHGSRPTTGLSSVPKTTEATATELTTVEEKIIR